MSDVTPNNFESTVPSQADVNQPQDKDTQDKIQNVKETVQEKVQDVKDQVEEYIGKHRKD